MWQLAGIAILALSVWGFIVAHDSNEQKIGFAKAEAQHEKERADEEELIGKANEMARQDAVKALDVARKRQDDTRQQQLNDQLGRRMADDLRAKDDREFALWREQKLPAYVIDTDNADRLRIAAILGLAVPANSSLPAGAGVSGGGKTTSPSKDQRGIAR